MQYNIQYYLFLLKSLTLLEQMVKKQAVSPLLSPKAEEITQELLTAIGDYIEIVKEEWIKSEFWDIVLSDDWARELYYSEPDEKNWFDRKEDEDEDE